MQPSAQDAPAGRVLLQKRAWEELFTLLGFTDSHSRGVRFQSRIALPNKRFDWIEMLYPGSIAGMHLEQGAEVGDAFSFLEKQCGYITVLHNKPKMLLVLDRETLYGRALSDMGTGPILFAPTDNSLPDSELGRALAEAISTVVRNETEEQENAANDNAAKKLNLIHKALVESNYGVHETNVLLPRLLFLMFADDTAMWGVGQEGWFRDYLLENTSEDGADMGAALTSLFAVLDTPSERRQKGMPVHLGRFPYVGGSLFSEQITPPIFNEKMRKAVLDACVYDWTLVNPAIFGSLYQQLRTREERHEGGEHYTSEENIRKVIDPLFLDNLVEEMLSSWDTPGERRIWKQSRDKSSGRQERTLVSLGKGGLHGLRERLSELQFLDPACGSGNFLIVSYLKLRELDLEITLRLEHLENTGTSLHLDGLSDIEIYVSPDQFHGIEISEWSGLLAETAMAIAHHQANRQYGEAKSHGPAPFPLMKVAKISYGPDKGNALRVDWSSICPMGDTTFIMGNPPFLGATSKKMTVQQKADRAAVWGSIPRSGALDFVACWLLLAGRHLQYTQGRAAFVSTNSVTQGVQPPVLWGALTPLGMGIDFAHRTFEWANDASGKAAVHCVIVGFSAISKPDRRPLWVYSHVRSAGQRHLVPNINAYLLDAPNVLVGSRGTWPISSGAPLMVKGSQPTDGGHLSKITDEEAERIRQSDPVAARYLRPLMGSDELINGLKRWCLWLTDSTPAERRLSQEIRTRSDGVRLMRANSTKASTNKDAATPWLFQEDRQPKSSYLAVPEVSSEFREYVPMQLLNPDTVPTNKIQVILGGKPRHLGILSSSIFRIWAHAISGRLGSSLSISAEITYNNFPWPEFTDATKSAVESAAQAVLDARALYPDSSLADLYDPLAMPSELRKAHRDLDKAVLSAYGLPVNATDAEILEHLFTRYAELVAAEEAALPKKKSKSRKTPSQADK